MPTSVLIKVRLPQELSIEFGDICTQQGVTVSEAVRRLIEHTVLQTSVKPDENIWNVIGKGVLPPGFRNRFAMLPELAKDLPEKDYEGEEPWHVRSGNRWKTPESLRSEASALAT